MHAQDSRSFLIGWTSPEGHGGYSEVRADRDLDAIRQFRLWFGSAFHISQVMEVTT